MSGDNHAAKRGAANAVRLGLAALPWNEQQRICENTIRARVLDVVSTYRLPNNTTTVEDIVRMLGNDWRKSAPR